VARDLLLKLEEQTNDMEKLRREKRLWVIVFKRSHISTILNWMPLIKGVDLAPLNGDLNGEGPPAAWTTE
jgi:hypothetical protein